MVFEQHGVREAVSATDDKYRAKPRVAKRSSCRAKAGFVGSLSHARDLK